MTLMVHKVIDALRGDKRYPLIANTSSAHKLEDLIRLIEAAEKFDFCDLVLEPDPPSGQWQLPKLTETELEFFREGLIVLPSSPCWFECHIGGIRSGILISEKEFEWQAIRIDLLSGDRVAMDTTIAAIDRRHTPFGSKIELIGDKKWLAKVETRASPNYKAMFYSQLHLAVYLALMLNSKTSETTVETAPEKLNKRRAQKGLAPLVTHRVVRIVPRKYQYERTEGGDGVERRSPRLHWRRSHLRHYDHQVESAKFMAEIEHKGKKGWWVTVIPRFLVGKAELGEISHEYRVEEPK